ncbi:MAG: hypothetical protein ACREOI_20360 [bacterium]
MAFQTHDVWLVNFPFSDLSTAKARPAVVVSSAVYHQNEVSQRLRLILNL